MCVKISWAPFYLSIDRWKSNYTFDQFRMNCSVEFIQHEYASLMNKPQREWQNPKASKFPWIPSILQELSHCAYQLYILKQAGYRQNAGHLILRFKQDSLRSKIRTFYKNVNCLVPCQKSLSGISSVYVKLIFFRLKSLITSSLFLKKSIILSAISLLTMVLKACVKTAVSGQDFYWFYSRILSINFRYTV